MIRSTIIAAAIAALAVTACNAPHAPAASPISFGPGQGGAIDLPAGHYRVTWSGDCAPVFLEVARVGAATIDVPSPGPSGSLELDWPGGRGFVNSGWPCDYVVTVGPA